MRLIVAFQKKDRGIGDSNNSIPWKISEDLKYFKEQTSKKKNENEQNVLIMGRKTWESIPENYRELKNRTCYVVSRNESLEFKNQVESYKDTYLVSKLDQTSTFMSNTENVNVWIIGGASIYNEMITNYGVSEIYATEIYTNKGEEYDCSSYFPNIDENRFKLRSVSPINTSTCKNTEKTVYFRYLIYADKDTIDPSEEIWQSSEVQYLDALREIKETGIENIDRTGVGTLSKFGMRFEYNLKDGFPALTTKRIFLRGVFEELMMYLRGHTDNKVLQDKSIHIWDGNTTREFLDARGLTHYPEGDMGETYGFNFRHFGGEYKTCKETYNENNGFDQLNYVINLIKNDPSSRRIIINLWNSNTLHKAALPSCLCQYQFYVNTEKEELDLQIYIRSSDFFLANNWNTCTGAFFVHMLCRLEGISLSPGRIVVVTGDTHLYLTHLEGVGENLKRIPRPLPQLNINGCKRTSIEEFTWDDINLIGYFPQKNIRADMAV
jgi:dihydrofolate reductase / thymidylate synthase